MIAYRRAYTKRLSWILEQRIVNSNNSVETEISRLTPAGLLPLLLVFVTLIVYDVYDMCVYVCLCVTYNSHTKYCITIFIIYK